MKAAHTTSPVTFTMVRPMSSRRSTPRTRARPSGGTPTCAITIINRGSEPPGTPAAPIEVSTHRTTTSICSPRLKSTPKICAMDESKGSGVFSDRSIFSAWGWGSEGTSPEERGLVEAWRGRKAGIDRGATAQSHLREFQKGSHRDTPERVAPGGAGAAEPHPHAASSVAA